MEKSKACQEIETSVLKADLCTLCGACIGNCPYLVAYEGRIVMRDVCDLPEGRCTAFCPRLSLDLDDLSRRVFGASYTWDALGNVLSIGMARSTDAAMRTRSQDAGTVTSLTRFALDEGFIDSAVVTFFNDKTLPHARAVSHGEDLLQSVGSNYMAVPVLEAFNRAIAELSHKRVGVVGTPCQTLALAKMKGSQTEKLKGIEKLELVIGLFCTWALSYPHFADFLEKEVPDTILKFKVPPPPANVLQALTANGQIDVPLGRITPFIRPACSLCHDMTSEFADISIGAVEFADSSAERYGKEAPAWNTVIVRTEKGRRLLDRARSKGIIETAELPEKILDHLKYAARNKKKRALQHIVKKTGSQKDLLYLKTESSIVATLLEE